VAALREALVRLRVGDGLTVHEARLLDLPATTGSVVGKLAQER
jgi:hypothetical protein